MREWHRWSVGSIQVWRRGEEMGARDRQKGGGLQHDEVRRWYRLVATLRSCDERCVMTMVDNER